MNPSLDPNCIDATKIGALIPAYREAEHIGDVVRRLRGQLDTIYVVDDGSPDDTAACAMEAEANVILHTSNKGKGAAIKTGLRAFLATKFEYVVILDGDGQHLPEEIGRFVKAAANSPARIFIGNRMQDCRGMPVVRRMTNRLMSWIISRICGQVISDTQCGFRMIHRDLIPSLLSETNGFDYETEMLIIAAQTGCLIANVPVSTVYANEKSKIRPIRDTLRFVKLLSRYWGLDMRTTRECQSHLS